METQGFLSSRMHRYTQVECRYMQIEERQHLFVQLCTTSAFYYFLQVFIVSTFFSPFFDTTLSTSLLKLKKSLQKDCLPDKRSEEELQRKEARRKHFSPTTLNNSMRREKQYPASQIQLLDQSQRISMLIVTRGGVGH